MMACPAVLVELEWGYHDAKQTGLKEKTCSHMNSQPLSLAATQSDWCASSLRRILMGGLKLVLVKSEYDKKFLIFLYRILLMDNVFSIQFKADLIWHHSLSWPFVMDCELFVAPLAVLPILVQSLCFQLKDHQLQWR